MFAGALVAAVVLGVLLTAGLTLLARTARTVAGARGGRMLVRTPAEERRASAQLTALAAAEDAFHSVCNTGYGDLEGLLQPGTVITDYPADGPAFLRGPAFETAERDGYRYTLTVEDEMPPPPAARPGASGGSSTPPRPWAPAVRSPSARTGCASDGGRQARPASSWTTRHRGCEIAPPTHSARQRVDAPPGPSGISH